MKKKYFKLLLSVCALCVLAGCSANGGGSAQSQSVGTEIKDEGGVIKLLSPNLDLEVTLMQSLKERRSTRGGSDEMISLEELSNLLWASNGYNREDKRTAPSAINAQDIDIYVCFPFGAYLYEAKENLLTLVTKENLCEAVMGDQVRMMGTAPVNLVFVSDWARFGNMDEALCQRFADMDASYVSAQTGLYCAAAGLGTVPRYMGNWEALHKGLKLRPTQHGILNNPIWNAVR